MKFIMSIIRIDKINETKKALTAAGLDSFTAGGKVFGRGKGKYDAKVLEGVKQELPEAISVMGPEPRLRPHRLITIAVADKMVKTAVNAIISANKTDKPGDGKIFVLPLTDAVRVRTGEYGENVI
jgi:nitrogen regulatory protein PII 2